MLMQRLVAKYNMIVSGFGTPESNPEWVKLSKVGRLNKPLECVKCGCPGTIIVQHRHANEPETALHHDVFGINKHNDIVMLTVDHILPQSWGGNGFKTNLQVMCMPCNAGKKNLIKKAEAESIIKNLPNHYIMNGKSDMLLHYIAQQHPSLATLENFRLIKKQLPRVTNFNHRSLERMVDKMQDILAIQD